MLERDFITGITSITIGEGMDKKLKVLEIFTFQDNNAVKSAGNHPQTTITQADENPKLNCTYKYCPRCSFL